MGMKPFLRWAGSKRKLLPKLTSFWNANYERYVEPFMGSACFFFAVLPRRAILADLNCELVATYVEIRDNPESVWDCLSKFVPSEQTYYRLRRIPPSRLPPAEAAARFLFLNRFCFNGLYRTNLRGEFNVPYAPTRTGPLPTKDDLLRYSGCLRSADLRAGDFENTLHRVKKGDFVYLDPPFAVRTRRVFREYGASVFGEEDLARLAKCLGRLDTIGARFVISYADCAEARRLLRPWGLMRVRTHRHIAGFSSNRRHAFELVATNVPRQDLEES